MIRTEFGIIDKIDYNKDYSGYEPEKYHCVAIDDTIYINDWWNRLCLMKTYFHTMSRPETALARWGVTLIPPESLPAFLAIVLEDKRLRTDDHLAALAKLIRQAIDENKFMIHYGV